LQLKEVVRLHTDVVATTGGSQGLRDIGSLESALAQPRQSFDGADLYPDLVSKAAAMGFSLISNHPFVDGNKRIGHYAMEVFLDLNGFEISAGIDEQEKVVLSVASGRLNLDVFTAWLRKNTVGKSQK